MKCLNDLEPQKVFEFFEYISSVPRGSGNTSAVADLCVKFAQDRGLTCFRDAVNNVIIYKAATPGYENEPTIILQGHLDMVCAKNNECTKDMSKEPIDLAFDDKYVFAKGTTLGADDGIAIAYAMAILDSNDIKHPPIEAVFTIDEETGMDGASFIDASKISGRILLNIDSEEEGIFTCGCAGGCRVISEIPIKREAPGNEDEIIKIVLTGLKGGHSGAEIHRQPASANYLLGRVLYELYHETPFRINSFFGGKFDNVISDHTEAVISVEKGKSDGISSFIKNYNDDLKIEYGSVNPDIQLTYSKSGEDIPEDFKNPLSLKDTEKILKTIYLIRQGVIEMSMDLKGMVQTSQNLGIIKTDSETFSFDILVRSSIEGQKKTAINRIVELVKLMGGSTSFTGNYPGWRFDPNSKLREKCIRIYKKQYGKDPIVLSIHAGLECGIFADKLPGLDVVSIGPDILDIHTPSERLDIASVKRVWEFLISVLEERH